MMFPMKLFSLSVIVANVITPIIVVDAFSSSGVTTMHQQARTQTRTQSRAARQPSQQPSSMLPPLSSWMREGEDEFIHRSNNQKSTKKRATLSITSIIPTSTGIKATVVGTISLNNNYVEENMIADLQNQHVQMMRQMQQQQQQSSLYSVTIPPVSSYAAPSSSPSPILATAAAIPLSMTMMSTITAATNNVGGIYDKLHDDLTYINIQLLRSKLAFLHRLFPQNKKHMIDRFVNFLIQFIL